MWIEKRDRPKWALWFKVHPSRAGEAGDSGGDSDRAIPALKWGGHRAVNMG